jgi:SH3-like domain-containing protein
MVLGRAGTVAVIVGSLFGASVCSAVAAKDAALASSGLPVPRYVSLKSDHVNVRAGPLGLYPLGSAG